MSTTITSPYASPALLPSSNYAFPPHSIPMIRLSFPHLHLRHHLPRRHLIVSAAAVQQPRTQTWFQTPLTRIQPASTDSSLFHVTIDVSASPLPGNFTAAGQYVQVRIPSSAKPSFLAIASPPETARSVGVFEFLLKRIAGSTADLICEMREGEVVEVSGVMGNGFEIGKVADSDCVLMFATGSGISPSFQFRCPNYQILKQHIHSKKKKKPSTIVEFEVPNLAPASELFSTRSLVFHSMMLLAQGFDAKKKSDVRLYYGARNLQRMAYQERFEEWEETGVKIIPVLSQPDDRWKGEEGYIQAAFSRAKQIVNASSTGAVLCGHKQMTEEVTSMLEADGVSTDRILKNF